MRIIVVAPHADDETLGAGGYLLKQKQLGNEIFWLLITNISEEYGYTKEQCAVRNMQIEKVARRIGFDRVFDLGFKPAGLCECDQHRIIEAIKIVFDEVKPNVVILPNSSDIHTDHSVVFNAAFSCTKAFRCPSIKQILTMQILSETDYADSADGFVPNYYIDISDYLESKIQIAGIYSTEIQEHPFPRSKRRIEALALVNGGSAFCNAAEAFRIVKMID